MKKIIIILMLVLLIPFAYAQESAGITPDSVFYKLDVILDNVKAALTPSAVGRATVRLDIMEERLAEMEEMAEKNKTKEAKKAISEGQKQMEKFERSIEKIKKKNAEKLKENIQAHTKRLKMWKQRLGKYDIPDYADAMAEAIALLETTENVIVNIPEDLGPESTFILTAICKEAGATTILECNKLIASGALTASFRRVSREEVLADPHGCFSGHYSSYLTKTKYCCDDSDGTYSLEYVENVIMRGHIHMLDYYHRKGTVEYKIINLKTEEIEEGIETDSCDGDTLTEWFCPRVLNMITRNERYSEEFVCPLGCEDGACIPEEVPEIELPEGATLTRDGKIERKLCEDPDGGRSDASFIKSETKYVVTQYMDLNDTEGTIVKDETHIDSCDGDTLTEWLCMENNLHEMEHPCLFGCEEGACMWDWEVSEEVVQEEPEEAEEVEVPVAIETNESE